MQIVDCGSGSRIAQTSWCLFRFSAPRVNPRSIRGFCRRWAWWTLDAHQGVDIVGF